MNLLSRLGILFFTQTEKAAKGILDLEKRLESIRTKSKEFRSHAMDRASSSARQLASELDSLGQSAASGINLSSSLDSTYAQFDKTAQKLSASMGVSAKTIKQQAGFFYDLNMSGEEWLQTSAMMQKFKIDPKRMGVGSLKDYAKAVEVVGANGPELTKSLINVRQNFNQTDEELGQLLDDVALIGKRFGSSSEFVGQFSTVAGALNEQLRKIDPTADAKKYRDYAQQIYLVAGALQETTNADPAAALSSSVELFNKLADTQADFESLFAGAGNGIPELMNQVAMAMGGFDEIKASPIKFVEAISTAYAEASDEQRTFMRKQLTNSFGADLDYLFQGEFGKVAGKLKAVREEVNESTGAFKELAKAYRTGFTDQELYSRASEKFEHRMTGVTRQIGVQNKVLASQRGAYKLVGDQIGMMAKMHLSSKKGGLGRALTDTETAMNLTTRAFLAYRSAGLQGLASELVTTTNIMKGVNTVARLTGFEFKDGGEEATSYAEKIARIVPKGLATAEALNKLGINFGTVGAMATAMAAPLRIVNALFMGMPAKLLGVLGPIGLIAGAGFLIYKNWDKGVGDFFKKTLGKMESKVKELAPVIKTALLEGMGSATKFLNEADTKKGGEEVAKFMGKVFFAAADFMGEILSGLYVSIFGDEKVNKDAANTAGESLGKAFGSMGGAAINALGRGLSGALGQGLDYLKSDRAFSEKATGVGKFIAGAVGTGLALRLAGALTGSTVLAGAGKALTAPLMLGAKGVAKGAGAAKGKLAASGIGAKGVAKGLGTLGGLYGFATEGPAAFEAAFDMIVMGGDMSYDKLMDTGYKSASGFAKVIDLIFMGIPSTILKYLGIGEKQFKIFYNELVTETSIRIKQVMTFFQRFGLDFNRIFEFAKFQVKDLGMALFEISTRGVRGLTVGVAGFVGDVEDGLTKAKVKFNSFFESIRASGEASFLGLKFTLRDFATNVLDEYLGPVLSRIEFVGVNAIRLAQKLGMPTRGLTEDDMRLASRLGLDKEGIAQRRREQASELMNDMITSRDATLNRLKQIGLEAGMDPEAVRRASTVEQMTSMLKDYDPGRGEAYRTTADAKFAKVISQVERERATLSSDHLKAQAALNERERGVLAEQRNFEAEERASSDRYAANLFYDSMQAKAVTPAQMAAVAPPETPVVSAKPPAQTAENRKKAAGGGMAELATVSMKGFKSVVDKLDEVIKALDTKPARPKRSKSEAEMFQ